MLALLIAAVIVATQVGDATDAIKRTNAYRVRALQEGDATTLARVLGDDLTYIGPTGVLETKADILRAATNGFKTPDREHREVTVRVYGDTAVLTYLSTPQAGTRGAAQRSTCVYVNREGRWQLVGQQVTRIAR